MKGKNYVPHSGTVTHLGWHYNDGTYTYGNRKDIEAASPKPWETDQDAPIIYNWSTSLPYSWRRLKSPEKFKHVREMNQHTNTLEFLNETQKYIHLICHPTIPVEQNHNMNKVIHSSLPSRKTARTAVKKSVSPVGSVERPSMDHEEALKLSMIFHKRDGSASSPFLANKSKSGKFIGKQLEQSNTEETLKRSSSAYLVNTCLVPRSLTSPRRNRKSPPKVKNDKIQEFLNRFQKSKGSSISLKQTSSKGNSAVPFRQKLSLLTMLKRKKETKDYFGPALTKSLSTQKVAVRSRRLKTSSYSRMLESCADLSDNSKFIDHFTK